MTETGDELQRQLRVGVMVELTNCLLGMPRHANLVIRVTGIQQTAEFRSASLVKAFIGFGQKTPATIDRIMLVATMTERLVLNPTTNLVEPLVGQLDHVERVSDLDRFGNHGDEHQPIRTRQIQRRPLNPV